MRVVSSCVVEIAMTTTLGLLQRILLNDLGLSAQGLRPETRLEELGVDSLTFIEMTFALEKELHIRFPEDARSVRTVGDVAAIIDKLRGTVGA